MMKRFFIGYSLITFFFLNSVVLFAQHKNSFTKQWKIEDESHALQMIEHADTLELIVPKGLTMWYGQRLTGDYEISYRICMVMKGGTYDRLSDLNCFGLPMTLNILITFLPVASGGTVSLKTTIH